MCHCTLPPYTLKGSMDLCADSKSNCAIYTGRLLGSDNASATEVFEMVEEWLAIQNGSLMNGTLSVDPNCTLRRFSPSDPACSYSIPIDINPPKDDDDDDGDNFAITMVIVGLASALVSVITWSIVIICAVYLCRSCKTMKEESLSSSTYPGPLVVHDNERHYSIIVDCNPSYDQCHGNNVRVHQKSSQNIELQEATVTNDNSSGSHAHQTTEVNTDQQPVTQSMYTLLRSERNVSETTSNGYVDCNGSLSQQYWNENENVSSRLGESYLPIIHTE